MAGLKNSFQNKIHSSAYQNIPGGGGGSGGKNRMYFICLQVDGPITEGAGEGLISGSLRRYSNLSSNVRRLLH